MTLDRPWALALLVALPVLWRLHRRRAPRIVRVASLDPYRAGAGTPPPNAQRRAADPVLALLLAAATALALAAAGPRWGSARDAVRVVRDPSPSMAALMPEPSTETVTQDAERRLRALLSDAVPGAEVADGPATDDPVDALAAARADGFPGVVYFTDHAVEERGVAAVGPSAGARGNVALSGVLPGTAVLRNFGTAAAEVEFVDDRGAVRITVAPRDAVAVPAAATPGTTWRIRRVDGVPDALAADDEVRVPPQGGAATARLHGDAPHVERALRALGALADGPVATLHVAHGGGASGVPVGARVLHFAPPLGASAGVRVVPGAREVDASRLVSRDAAFPLPPPSTRLVATGRLEGGEPLLEDERGALVARGPSGVVVALDPEDAGSDWARDGSFAAAVGAALDLARDAPPAIPAALPPAESDVARGPVTLPSADAVRALVRRSDAARTDLATPLALAGAACALVAAALGRRARR